MDLIEHLLMKLVSFGGIGFLIYIFVQETSTYSNTVPKREK